MADHTELRKKAGSAADPVNEGKSLNTRNEGKSSNAGKKASPAEERRKKIRRRAWLRAALQLFFFLTMPGAFVAGFNGVKNICGWVHAGEVLQLNSFAKVLIMLIVFTMIFGRFFCGYVCAFGALGDLVNYLSGLVQKKIFKKKKQFRIPASVSVILQKLKYLNLLVIVLLCCFGKFPSGTSAWDVFSRVSALQSVPAGYAVGVVCLVVVIVGMAVQERFFCQYLCPLGALFALLPILPTGSLHRNEPNCIRNCKICDSQCPVSLKLHANGDRGGECIGCEKCVGVCPRGNIAHVESRILPADWIATLVKAAVMFALGCLLGL